MTSTSRDRRERARRTCVRLLGAVVSGAAPAALALGAPLDVRAVARAFRSGPETPSTHGRRP
ncbi:hypothetical protein [Aquipuribacter nitratireducens]|uniref:Uncharacterized protein n=1 Tax=Aquipuribacter nitratireducens TaxID=650104 RepID=A0ABW0GPK4_9MICO